jgi:hypothetical protein
LDVISTFKVFADLDMANSYHQLKLAKNTSEKLSIQTPWGQFEPKFLPEGVGPASGLLQSVVNQLFSEFSEWCIAIFDNILMCGHDYEDLYLKVELILQVCLKHNIVLKFSKSFIGMDHDNFFGYVVKHQSYELSAERKASIAAMPFPINQKTMQRFMGSALFFKSFVPDYSNATALLNDMTKVGFPWHSPDTWKHNYKQLFEDFKALLQQSMALNYPDYSLPWILRTDASHYGVAAALFQLKDSVLLPIAFVSQKFSDVARRWDTIEKEGYGCYFGVHKLSYYLRCKPFILETDHNNLVWMEASLVPKIIRWRIYLQDFDFTLRHIPGKLNVVADYLSRMYVDEEEIAEIASMELFLSIFDDQETSASITLASSTMFVNAPSTVVQSGSSPYVTTNSTFPSEGSKEKADSVTELQTPTTVIPDEPKTRGGKKR